MNQKNETIKKHFRENKKVYIVGSISFVIGAASVFLVTRSGNISISNPALLNWKPAANTIQITMTRPGPKSFVIQALETQQTWPSLRAAAKDLGHNPGTLSAHLKGLIPDINGLHLVKVAEI